MDVTNTLAYYEITTFMAVKRFIVQVRAANVIKPFYDRNLQILALPAGKTCQRQKLINYICKKFSYLGP